jgi:UDP-hydrolysing UDP-N-acetyl-D-glucosamine 2-epimerase
MRHAITKMSHIHFASTEKYKEKIIQMGELPENVFCFGAPGLDHIYKLKLMNERELSGTLGIPYGRKIGIVTYHPVTLEKNTSETHISELLEAIQKFPDIFWVFTMPNADTRGRIIGRKIEDFLNKNPDRGNLFASLGQFRYLSLMKHASVMVGNSSSGLIEAPSFKLPVVNIGYRQSGRVRGQNVIDVAECNEKYITEAIHKALSAEFKRFLKSIENPYGKGNTSERIVEKLKDIMLDENIIKKKFYEIL